MKTIVKLALILLLPITVFAQDGVRFTDQFGPFNEVYQQENDFTNRNYVQYPFVREADVIWKKVTWEIIDLREKVNLPLYYPTDTIHGRKSLINALMAGIENNMFNAFKNPLLQNAFEFDQNNIFLGIDEIRDIDKREDIEPVEIRPGEYEEMPVVIRWKPEEIKQVLVKEIWYFSRRDSKLHCEIIGLCPIREFQFNGLTRRQKLFWVYYPDTRQYLSTIPVYNPANDKAQYSFDDLLVHRYFSSYFVQEANVYNDRMITDYVTGREAQLESERIKREIFDFEQDLWEN